MKIVLSALVILACVSGCSNGFEPLPPSTPVHDKYPQVCDAKLELINHECAWEANCGKIDESEIPVCVAIYISYFGWSGCGYVPLHSDWDIDACLAAFDAMVCPDYDALPSACDNIFEPGDLADPGDATSPDQLPH
jgi:hypothetical protein